MPKLFVMTVDLETDLGADLDTVFLEMLPKVLDEFDARKIKATFFVVSSLLQKYSSYIKEISLRGHEIASHSRTHSFLHWDNSWEEIKGSFDDFAAAGITVSGFRAPGYVTVSSTKHLAMVQSAGYLYDASFAHFLPGRYFRLFMPSKPFVTSQGIVEMPMPRMIWPSGLSGLSYFRLFYPLSLWVSSLFGASYMFYFHLWEFIPSRRLSAKGLFEKLIAKGSGDLAWKRFISYLDLAARQNAKWVSCQEYLEKKKLL